MVIHADANRKTGYALHRALPEDLGIIYICYIGKYRQSLIQKLKCFFLIWLYEPVSIAFKPIRRKDILYSAFVRFIPDQCRMILGDFGCWSDQWIERYITVFIYGTGSDAIFIVIDIYGRFKCLYRILLHDIRCNINTCYRLQPRQDSAKEFTHGILIEIQPLIRHCHHKRCEYAAPLFWNPVNDTIAINDTIVICQWGNSVFHGQDTAIFFSTDFYFNRR